MVCGMKRNSYVSEMYLMGCIYEKTRNFGIFLKSHPLLSITMECLTLIKRIPGIVVVHLFMLEKFLYIFENLKFPCHYTPVYLHICK